MIFNERDVIVSNDNYVLTRSYRGYDIYAKSKCTGKWFVKYIFKVLSVAYKFFKNLVRGVYRG